MATVAGFPPGQSIEELYAENGDPPVNSVASGASTTSAPLGAEMFTWEALRLPFWTIDPEAS